MNQYTLYIILGIVIILFIIWISIYNKIVKLSKKVDSSNSQIDVFLKKRYDLIPNLVECVKGVTHYEESTLKEITELRNIFNTTGNKESSKKLNMQYQKLIGIVEDYPNIKSSDNFLSLQKQLVEVEDEIQASRRIYINAITLYNTLISSVPYNVIAKCNGYTVKDLPNYDYDDVVVDFVNQSK